MANLALAFDILARDKGASKTFDKVGDSADRNAKRGAKFGAVVGAGLGIAAVAVGKFAKTSVGAFKESEQASARLDDALAKFPATADRSRASFDKLNESLAKRTTFDDDALASGQAVLAQYKLTGKQIQDLTPLLADYAAKTGRDIPSAAGVLGKALQGKGKALGDVGIKFKDAGSTGKNFDQIMGGLRKQVGGFAEKEGKTAAGQAEILGNQYGELQEKVGAKLVPALAKLADKLLAVIDFVSRNSKVIGPLVVILGGLATVVYTIITAQKAWIAIQTALNIVLAANPIGIIVIALALLVTGLVLAYKKSETFRNIVHGVFKAVGGAVLGFVDLFLAAFQKFAQAMSHVPFIGDKFKGVAEGIGKVRDKIHGMQAELKQLGQNTVRVPIVLDVKSSLGKAVQSAVGTKLDRVTRASGGPVRAGQPYIVGEREPEWFVPDVSGQILNGRQAAAVGGGFTVEHLEVHAGPGEMAAESVPRSLRAMAFRLGYT